VACLTALAAAGLLSPGAPAHAQVDRWAAEIGEASARFGIPEDWIRRVMKAESDGRTELAGAPIVSRAGAMGLMQLMPGTWLEMRAVNRLGADPFNPHDNIIAGAAYLRAMYDRFGYPGLFAAYNAGPGRYADHLATGLRLPPETMSYIQKTVAGAASSAQPHIIARTARRSVTATIFAVRAAAARALPGDVAGAGQGASLFAIRR
jgi:soluble lytic murein transglycosylase-like protein